MRAESFATHPADAPSGSRRSVESGAEQPVIPGFYPDPSLCRVANGRFLIRLDDTHWYGLHLDDGFGRAEARVGDLRQLFDSREVPQRRLVLRIESVPPLPEPGEFGHGGPDDIILSVDDDAGRHDLARIDGRYLSTEVATGFTGRMLALGAGATEAHVVSVAYTAHRAG